MAGPGNGDAVTIDARDFGRLEGKVDEIRKLIERGTVKIDDLEERTRELETKQAHAAGRQSIISAAVSMVVAGAVAWTVKHFA